MMQYRYTSVAGLVTGKKRHSQLQSRGDTLVAILPCRQAIRDVREKSPDRQTDYANQSLAMRTSNDPLIVRLSFELDPGWLTGLSVLGSITPVHQKVSLPWIWRLMAAPVRRTVSALRTHRTFHTYFQMRMLALREHRDTIGSFYRRLILGSHSGTLGPPVRIPA